MGQTRRHSKKNKNLASKATSNYAKASPFAARAAAEAGDAPDVIRESPYGVLPKLPTTSSAKRLPHRKTVHFSPLTETVDIGIQDGGDPYESRLLAGQRLTELASKYFASPLKSDDAQRRNLELDRPFLDFAEEDVEVEMKISDDDEQEQTNEEVEGVQVEAEQIVVRFEDEDVDVEDETEQVKEMDPPPSLEQAEGEGEPEPLECVASLQPGASPVITKEIESKSLQSQSSLKATTSGEGMLPSKPLSWKMRLVSCCTCGLMEGHSSSSAAANNME